MGNGHKPRLIRTLIQHVAKLYMKSANLAIANWKGHKNTDLHITLAHRNNSVSQVINHPFLFIPQPQNVELLTTRFSLSPKMPSTKNMNLLGVPGSLKHTATFIRCLICSLSMLINWNTASTGWAKKSKPQYFTYNFVKYCPIFKILLLSHSPGNLQ